MVPLRILTVIFLLFSATLTAQVTPPPPDSAILEDKVFTKVEVEANYPGGEVAWKNFLIKNLNPDVPADNDAPAGKYTVIVKFVVTRNGTLSGIQAETNQGYGMEEEVLRLIKRSGTWEAAVQNKRTVNAYRRQPVTFLVEDDDFSIQSKVPYTFFTAGDNRIYIQAKKVKNENLSVSISEGSINSTGDDQYIVRVDKPGRVTLTLYNKKNNKKIGAASFEVKQKN
ncbi:MAG: energy transducer TonB [Ferruginibacter sp.]